jgi:hypothetical protein
LHHDSRAPQRGHRLEEAQHHGGGHRIRQVGHKSNRGAKRRHELLGADGHRVSHHDRQVRAGRRHVFEGWQERTVALESDDVSGHRAQRHRQGADPGPDLEHGVTRLDARELQYLADDVVIDEEVLREGLLGLEPVGRQDRTCGRRRGQRGV